jgi:hypothetical protein
MNKKAIGYIRSRASKMDREAIEMIRYGLEIRTQVDGEEINFGRIAPWVEIKNKFFSNRDDISASRLYDVISKIDPRIKFIMGSAGGRYSTSGIFYIPSDAPKIRFLKYNGKELTPTPSESKCGDFWDFIKSKYYDISLYDTNRRNKESISLRKAFFKFCHDMGFNPRDEYLAGLFRKNRTSICNMRTKIYISGSWYKMDEDLYNDLVDIWKHKENLINFTPPKKMNLSILP